MNQEFIKNQERNGWLLIGTIHRTLERKVYLFQDNMSGFLRENYKAHEPVSDYNLIRYSLPELLQAAWELETF
jgi:hypothetical protein